MSILDANGWTYETKCRDGEFIMHEGGGGLSRKKVTLAAGNKLIAGTVLGKVTATGKYGPYSNAASDGRQVAAGILIYQVDATSGDLPAVMMGYHAVVMEDVLTGLDSDGKADLELLRISFMKGR